MTCLLNIPIPDCIEAWNCKQDKSEKRQTSHTPLLCAQVTGRVDKKFISFFKHVCCANTVSVSVCFLFRSLFRFFLHRGPVFIPCLMSICIVSHPPWFEFEYYCSASMSTKHIEMALFVVISPIYLPKNLPHNSIKIILNDLLAIYMLQNFL